jgi:AsmA protein
MRKLLIGIAVVLVLAVAAVVAVPLLVPVDAYKGRVVGLVKEATGRDFAINGPVRFSLLPNLALEAHDVALANVAGGSAPEMARLKTLEVRLKLLPLLHGAVEVDRFVLVEPTIALEIDKQGRPNWLLGAGTAAAAPSASPAPPSAPAAPQGTLPREVSLGDIRLVDGAVSFLDRRSGAHEEISGITLALAGHDLDSPLAADGSAQWRGQKLDLKVRLAQPRAALSGGASPLSLSLHAAQAALTFDGTATAGAAPIVDGTLDLTSPSLKGLAAWAGTPLTGGLANAKEFAVKGKIHLEGKKIAFDGASIALDALHAQGDLALDAGGARPAVKARLDLDQLDLNPYLPPPAEGEKGGAAAGAGGGGQWSDAPLDLAALGQVDASLDLRARSLKLHRISLGASQLAIQLAAGKLSVDLSRLELYRGSAKGRVELDAGAAAPALAMKLSVSQVQVEPLLRAAAGMDRLSGTGSFEINVTGSGRSERDLIASLDGKCSLNIVKGALKGADLVALVQSAAAPITGGNAGGETQFSSLSATYTIAKGVMRNSDLKMKTLAIPMEGAGTIDLPQRSVDYRLTPRLAGLVGVPVLIKGPWDNLSYAPDVVGIVTEPAKQIGGAAEGAGEVVKGVTNPVGGALKGLFNK